MAGRGKAKQGSSRLELLSGCCFMDYGLLRVSTWSGLGWAGGAIAVCPADPTPDRAGKAENCQHLSVTAD